MIIYQLIKEFPCFNHPYSCCSVCHLDGSAAHTWHCGVEFIISILQLRKLRLKERESFCYDYSTRIQGGEGTWRAPRLVRCQSTGSVLCRCCASPHLASASVSSLTFRYNLGPSLSLWGWPDWQRMQDLGSEPLQWKGCCCPTLYLELLQETRQAA